MLTVSCWMCRAAAVHLPTLWEAAEVLHRDEVPHHGRPQPPGNSLPDPLASFIPLHHAPPPPITVSLTPVSALVQRGQGPGRPRHQGEAAQGPEEAGEAQVLQRGSPAALGGGGSPGRGATCPSAPSGLRRGVQQHHGIRVPHEEVWEAGVRAGEAAAQLLPLWEGLQVQGRSGVPPQVGARSCESPQRH